MNSTKLAQATTIAISENDYIVKGLSQKRRKKRRQLNAYLGKRKWLQSDTTGHQNNLLDNSNDDDYYANANSSDNDDSSDHDSYADAKKNFPASHRSSSVAHKLKHKYSNVFMMLWTLSWLVGTLFSIWIFFDINNHFARIQLQIDEIKNHNFEKNSQMLFEMIDVFKMEQTKIKDKLRKLDVKVADCSSKTWRRELDEVRTKIAAITLNRTEPRTEPEHERKSVDIGIAGRNRRRDS